VLTYGDFGLFNVIRHKCDSDVCELSLLFAIELVICVSTAFGWDSFSSENRVQFSTVAILK
jgi:hypothetical protein